MKDAFRSRTACKVLALALILAVNLPGFWRKKKYENPIATNSQQPDKTLFDRAISDIEHGRYEVARLTLQTLINTYPDSEYLAKAKLAVADSWFREGGASGYAQAEAEYRDFITFFPSMEEAAESQMKICQIQYRQMEKPDRDINHSTRAEAECRQLILQFPNSKFVPDAEQMLREIQEVIAEGEYRVGRFYAVKGSYRAATTRLSAVTSRYPLYSKSGDALFLLGDTYGKMGKKYEDKSAQAFTRLVREYPLSARFNDARGRLSDLNRPIPDPDEAALARMQYNLDHQSKVSLKDHALGIFSKKPSVAAAARAGEPTMTLPPPIIPEGVNIASPGAVSAEVGAQTITGPSALDTQPDARAKPPVATGSQQAVPTASAGDAAGSTGNGTGAPAAASAAAGQSGASAAQDAQSSSQSGQSTQSTGKKKKRKKTSKEPAPQSSNSGAAGTASNN